MVARIQCGSRCWLCEEKCCRAVDSRLLDDEAALDLQHGLEKVHFHFGRVEQLPPLGVGAGGGGAGAGESRLLLLTLDSGVKAFTGT